MQEAAQEQVRDKEQDCSICFVSSNKPVYCKGPCHKLFCLKCAAQAKTQSDRCPNRCSAPFEVALLASPRLLCPYKPKQCIVSISTEIELSQHYKACPLISKEQREQADYKLNYKCKKGHDLTFLPKSALDIMYGKLAFYLSGNCSQCKQEEVCRAICISCSLSQSVDQYCVNCRSHPCSKQLCPLGHKLKHRNKPGKMRYCDFCDVPAGLLGRKVHGFCTCDFDLCDLCYEKLPEKNEKIPLKYNPEKIWPLAMINDGESDDSDWKQ